MAEAYPLYWPEGWKRTVRHLRVRSKFKTGFGAARQFLIGELERLRASRVIISTSIPLRGDGLPRSGMKPDDGDTGVAVYFERKGKKMVLACDQYDRSEDNVYAIGKTIEAMRGIERWGASEIMERAFSGFKALNAENAGESWWTVLGVSATATNEEVEAAYRVAIRKAHPDAGGTNDQMVRLNLSRDQARMRRGGE